MLAVMDFRRCEDDLPEVSGNYLTITSRAVVIGLYYNADTKRWNDYTGDGSGAINVKVWAEMPNEVNEMLEEEA